MEWKPVESLRREAKAQSEVWVGQRWGVEDPREREVLNLNGEEENDDRWVTQDHGARQDGGDHGSHRAREVRYNHKFVL